jgi:hypothetical protein
VCPAGWVVHGAARYTETFSRSDKLSLYVSIRQPELEIASSFCQISLHYDEPKKILAGKEIEAWLRNWADTSHLELRNGDRSYGLAEYRNRPGTFVMRTIAGRPALSWESEGNWRGKDVIEYVTAIYWESGWCEARCYVQVGASAEEADKIRAGYNRFVDSVRLP